MRLSGPKIQSLGDGLAAWLARREGVEVLVQPEVLARELVAAIRGELRREDELDEEVEALIRQHRAQIQGQNVDLSVLRLKLKKKLARERGIVL
jgi:hypothetical protein